MYPVASCLKVPGKSHAFLVGNIFFNSTLFPFKSTVPGYDYQLDKRNVFGIGDIFLQAGNHLPYFF